MTLLDSLLLLGGAISNLFVGYWIKAHGFFGPLVFVLGVTFLALLYAIFLIPETLAETSQTTTNSKRMTWRHLKHGVMLYLQDNGTGRRWKLNILVISYLVAEIITVYRVMTLFEMNAPLCWNSVMIGYFGASAMLIKCIATILAAGILKRWFNDETLALIAKVSSVAENIYMALVSSTLMMFFGKVYFKHNCSKGYFVKFLCLVDRVFPYFIVYRGHDINYGPQIMLNNVL